MGVKYTAPVDPHVHLRWNENGGKKYLEMGMRHANEVGLSAVIEMPNTSPSLTDKATIDARKRLADTYAGEVDHFIHVGVTPNIAQQRDAFNLVTRPGNRVVAGKTFYVRSTASGEIEITNERDQRAVWRHKADLGYKGPEIGHFEEGALFREKFDHTRPETHSLRQCPEAEPVQFERQFRLAYDAGFEGKMVVLHTSNPDTVDLSRAMVKSMKPRFEVFHEVTPHHMLLNVEEDYAIHRNRVKMNPPIRPKEMQERLLEKTLKGEMHFIGTDHAPHPVEAKDSGNPPSGIPGIPIWPKLIEKLRGEGIDEDLLRRLTFDNANELYGLGLEPKGVEVEYKPELWDEYGWNPFSRVDGTS